jgi:hypothetical protein
MIYGFENNKFYINFYPCQRKHGNMREETDARALELAESGSKFILSFSGGIDSQAVLHSFYKYNIPLETAFLYLPKYNDQEYEQVKILDKKYNRKTWIIDLDPIAIKKEILAISEKLDITAKNNILQRKFLSLLPDNYDFIQMVHDPYVLPLKNNSYYIQSYYMPEISRQRALDSLERNGKNIFYGDTTEFLMSIIDDEIFKSAIISFQYYDGNGLNHPNKNLKTVDRWDFYIKPLIYAKYWGNELIYFPKFAGFENIDYLHGNIHMQTRKHMIAVDYKEFLDFNNDIGSEPKRFFENVKEISDA